MYQAADSYNEELVVLTMVVLSLSQRIIRHTLAEMPCIVKVKATVNHASAVLVL